jgi:exonuclease III
MPRHITNLKISTRNVRGLLGTDLNNAVPAKLHALCRTWIHRQLDIVCLQETWVTVNKIPFAELNLCRASQLLSGRDWVAF